MNLNIQDLRAHYSLAALDREHVGNDPMILFAKWFDEALNAQLPEPNAMVLSTVNKLGIPRSRAVLLKGVELGAFVFYSNYNSDKGKEIDHNPNVSLNFLWLELERQVRIEGSAHKIPEQESEAYFRTRPKGSQIGAWVSQQSSVIANRKVLDQRLFELEEEYKSDAVPRPPWWGGYAVVPNLIEFWQGRPNRLHDRMCFIKDEQSDLWSVERLSP